MGEIDARLSRKHFSAKVYKAYLSYLELNHPTIDLEKLCLDAGLPLSYLRNENNWVSVIFDARFTKLAIDRSNQKDLPYRVGAHAMSKPALGTMYYLVVNNFIPLGVIYEQLPRLTALFSTITRVDIIDRKAGVLSFDIIGLVQDLDVEETKALEGNFENIFQNTLGYVCNVPVHRGLPPAQVTIDANSKETRPLSHMIQLSYEIQSIRTRNLAIIAPSLLTVISILFLPHWLVSATVTTLVWIAYLSLYQKETRERFNQIVRTLQQLDQRYSDLQNAKEEIRRVSEGYQRFVPWEVLQLMNVDSAANLRLGMNITRIMTVLFIDIRGFTQIANQLAPQEVFAFMNDFFSRVAPNVRASQGFVDKYTGDGLMAIFPARPDDALNAADSIRISLATWNQERTARGQREVVYGIGIQTGKLTLGLVGFEGQLQATALADVVNSAASLETLTKDVPHKILVGETTVEFLENSVGYKFQDLGMLMNSKQTKPIHTFAFLQKKDTSLERDAKVRKH